MKRSVVECISLFSFQDLKSLDWNLKLKTEVLTFIYFRPLISMAMPHNTFSRRWFFSAQILALMLVFMTTEHCNGQHTKVIIANKHKSFMDIKYLRWKLSQSSSGAEKRKKTFLWFWYNECLCRQNLRWKKCPSSKEERTFFHHRALQFHKSFAIRKWCIKVTIAFARTHNCHRKTEVSLSICSYISSTLQLSSIAIFLVSLLMDDWKTFIS